MRCLIWAAVSSKPQSEEAGKDSIPAQIAAARELIERNEGWHEVAEPLIIPGHSRNYIFLSDSVSDMPQYAQLINHARERSIDLLICRGRDRLGRTDALIAQVEEYLASYNVQILSLSMPTRVQDPEEFARRKDRASIWMRSVERAKAQDEIAELKARREMGMRRRIKEGLNPGCLPLGYRKNLETGIGEVYEPEVEVVRLIFRWFLEGDSLTAILRKLPAYTTARRPKTPVHVRYILENPFYAGLVAWNRKVDNRWRPRKDWLMAEGQHEGIISLEMWEAVQTEIAARRSMGRKHPYTENPLSGITFCGYCGGRMGVDRGKSQPIRYYVCKTESCGRNSIRLDRLEEVVAEWIRYHGIRPEIVQELLQSLESGLEHDFDMQHLKAVLKGRESALERWTRDYEDGLLPRAEYYQHKLRLEDEISETQAAIEEKESRKINASALVESFDGLAQLMKQAPAGFRQRPENLPQIKAALRAIGLRITVKDRHAEITLAP